MLSAALLCLIAGAAVGLLNGLLGMGGAFIIVPSISHILAGLGAGEHEAQLMAIGSAPAAMFLTCLSSFRTHAGLGNVNYPMLMRLGAGCAVGSFCGAAIAPHIPVVYLKLLFALLCLFMGGVMALSPSFEREREKLSWLGAAGAFFGFIASLTGLAGTLICLTWLNWRGVSWRKAVGAASGLGLVTTLFITVSYAVSGFSKPGLPLGSLGYIWLPGVFMIMLPGIFTAMWGARMLAAKNFPIPAMKKAAGLILILICLQIIYSAAGRIFH